MPWVDAIEPPLTPAERQVEEDVRIGHEDRRPEPTLNQRIIGAIREARAQSGWRSIETAPKEDGVWIFACRAGSKIPMVAGWDEEDGWWFAFNRTFDKDWQPTHWMPLPAPPAE